MLKIRRHPRIEHIDAQRIRFKGAPQQDLPAALVGLAHIPPIWSDVNDVDLLGGYYDPLLKQRIVEVGTEAGVLPGSIRQYLVEQFPEAQTKSPLKSVISGSSNAPIWLGIPYESPRELAGSTAAGCAEIIRLCLDHSPDLLGILPAKAPSTTSDATLRSCMTALKHTQRPTGVIGGDHRATWTTLEALRFVDPDRAAVHIQFDAHHDLYSEGGKSAAVNPANFNLDLLEQGTISALVLMGRRDSSEDVDRALAAGHAVFSHWQDVPDVLRDAHWHLSIDLDVLDPIFAKGVTNPLPNGWSAQHLYKELDALFLRRRPHSVSIVEATSSDAATVALAARLISYVDSLYEHY